MNTTAHTAQQARIASIATILHEAFNAGLLWGHPLVVAGLTATATFHARHAVLQVVYGAATRTVSLHDSDSEDATEAAIAGVVADVVTA